MSTCVASRFCTGVLLLATGGIMIPVVDMLYRDKITEAAVIANGSGFWKEWVSPSVPIYAQFYFFNVTNPQQVKDGLKPRLKERGPYTYREEREKVDIEFTKNGTVTYRERHRYFFQRNMSTGNESDLITTGNVIVMTAANLIQYLPPVVRPGASLTLSNARQDLFVTRSVRELLWGYTDKDLERLSQARPDWLPSPVVGYFLHKNNTVNELMSVFTGRNALENLGKVDQYNRSRSLSFWSSRSANMINGTDGSQFPPFRQGVETLDAFSPEICRSVKTEFQKAVSTKRGLKLRRFAVSESNLQNSSKNPANLGFCTPPTSCLPTGLLNLSSCIMGQTNMPVPAVASWPHFYQADSLVLHSVEGLSPTQEEHQSIMDVEPITGLVLQGHRRVQFNMHVMKVDGLAQTHDIRTLFFPIFWMDEKVELDQDQTTRLQRDLFAPMEISGVLEKVFMALGGCLIVAVMISARRNRRKKMVYPPGPVPADYSNAGVRRRPKRANGAGDTGLAAKESVPLLADQHHQHQHQHVHRVTGGHHDRSPTLPPPPVPSYQRPPVSNGQYHGEQNQTDSEMVEPVYQTALDA